MSNIAFYVNTPELYCSACDKKVYSIMKDYGEIIVKCLNWRCKLYEKVYKIHALVVTGTEIENPFCDIFWD